MRHVLTTLQVCTKQFEFPVSGAQGSSRSHATFSVAALALVWVRISMVREKYTKFITLQACREAGEKAHLFSVLVGAGSGR